VISGASLNRVRLAHTEQLEFSSEKIIVKRAHA